MPSEKKLFSEEHCQEFSKSKGPRARCHRELKDDDGANILLSDGEKPVSGNDESNIIPRGADLLLHLRNSAAEDGRKVSRLGVYQGYRVNILGRRERNLVLWIFNLSLPSLWRYGFS